MEPALDELKERVGEIVDLRRAANVLYWDQAVMMPDSGNDARGTQLATLERFVHERFVDDRIGELLDELQPYAESLPSDADDVCLIRVTRRDWDKARRVPTELTAELAKTGAEAYGAWVKARADSNFAAFSPWLEQMLQLRLRQIECFAPYEDPYDVLLDDYEPGMRTEEIRTVFAALEPELVALVAEHATDDEETFMRGPFSIDDQHALSLEVLTSIAGTADEYRLDPTVHPFEVTFGLNDIRLTTRYSENDLMSIFNLTHEAGHGVYEHGVSPGFATRATRPSNLTPAESGRVRGVRGAARVAPRESVHARPHRVDRAADDALDRLRGRELEPYLRYLRDKLGALSAV